MCVYGVSTYLLKYCTVRSEYFQYINNSQRTYNISSNLAVRTATATRTLQSKVGTGILVFCDAQRLEDEYKTESHSAETPETANQEAAGNSRPGQAVSTCAGEVSVL